MSVAAMAKKCARSRHRKRIDPGQAQVRLIDKRRGLQRMALALAAHVVVCEAAQLLVDDRHEPISCAGIVVRPIGQELRDGLRPAGVCFLAHRFSPGAILSQGPEKPGVSPRS